MQHPIVSVTRLLAQGFSLTLTGTEPTLTRGQGFKVPLTKKNQLLYMHLELAPLEQGYNLVIRNTPKGQAAMIAPTHGLTPSGPRVQQGGKNNYWKYNEQGYLVGVHKRGRKAMFTPGHGKQSTCPAPLDRFDNYRRTGIHGEQQEPLVLEDQHKTWRRKRGTESLQEAFGKEKHGSGYFLNKRKVQRGSSRSKHRASTEQAKH